MDYFRNAQCTNREEDVRGAWLGYNRIETYTKAEFKLRLKHREVCPLTSWGKPELINKSVQYHLGFFPVG